MAYAGSDYMRDGELVLANISDYNLTPELAIGLAGNIAQFNYKGNHVRTGKSTLLAAGCQRIRS
jgi:hypothetical protein